MWFIYSLLASFFKSVFDPIFKKATFYRGDLSMALFKLYDPIIVLFIFFFLILFWLFTPDKFIFSSYFIIVFVFFISVVNLIKNFLIQIVYRNLKISEILPYENLDKAFIVIVSFILYY